MNREYLSFLRNFIFDKNYRSKHLEFRRLSKLPRYTTTYTNLLGSPLEIVDTSSFFGIYKEVYENEIYRFKSNTETPFIIDGGSNIGLSIIYIKNLYPNAKILAFEPDENLFRVLTKNLHSFGINDVELHKEALWRDNTDLTFMAEGSDSGRVTSAREGNTFQVRGVRLRDFLAQKIDFLKLDIEGAEFDVLDDCRNELGNVDNLFVEYHSFEGQPQKISQLLEILISSGFRVNAHPCNMSKSPLFERSSYLGMDFQMNIFGYREA